MKAPKDHFTIQIDVTNACVHKCSNCTRFCGHLEKPYFMDFDYFCKAVDTLLDHPGLIGVMGGEPTLHPKFKEMCEYIQEKVGSEHPVNGGNFKYPTDHLVEERLRTQLKEYVIEDYEDGPRAIVKGAGLWTSVTPAFIKHYEIIQDTFNWQNLNDHTGASYHQPILITRKELGISDKEWLKLRERCWVNQEWSGSVTSKGCFFCEVAGAFDMMYDGPGGLPLEEGWWTRPIEDYKDQFRWCEMCGMPLKTFSRDAREETDDISEYHVKKLKESPKVKNGRKKTEVISISNGKISDETIKSAEKYRGQTYIDEVHDRVAGSSPIYARELYGVILDDGKFSKEKLKRVIDQNKTLFKELLIFTDRDDNENLGSDGIKMMIYGDDNVFDSLKKSIEYWGIGKYVVLFTPNILFTDKLETLKKCIINPGTLHYMDFARHKSGRGNGYIKNSEALSEGLCMMVNSLGMSYQKLKRTEGDFYHSLMEIVKQWDKSKIVEFSDSMDRNIYELNKGRGSKLERVKDFTDLIGKFIRDKGIGGTISFGIKAVRKYGVGLTLEKIRSRAY